MRKFFAWVMLFPLACFGFVCISHHYQLTDKAEDFATKTAMKIILITEANLLIGLPLYFWSRLKDDKKLL